MGGREGGDGREEGKVGWEGWRDGKEGWEVGGREVNCVSLAVFFSYRLKPGCRTRDDAVEGMAIRCKGCGQ